MIKHFCIKDACMSTLTQEPGRICSPYSIVGRLPSTLPPTNTFSGSAQSTWWCARVLRCHLPPFPAFS